MMSDKRLSKQLKAGFVSSLFLVSATAFAGSGSSWTYSGEKGPDNWAQLSSDYAMCGGQNQSPVNLTGFLETDLEEIDFEYGENAKEILNNGHTIQINFSEGSHIEVDGQEFKLLQTHLHAPSENHIEGKSYPLEAHFVHANSKGNLAVVALMFEEGDENAILAKAWKQLPTKADEKHQLETSFNGLDLMPEDKDYYRFNGSLTTPPCSEGVRWLVLKESVSASKAQIDAFAKAVHHANNRPIQPLNARQVLQ